MCAQITSCPVGPALGLPVGTTKGGLDPPEMRVADRLGEEWGAGEIETFH
jgi:hypothetical protein